jgi:glucose/arabinose dehydrogenase
MLGGPRNRRDPAGSVEARQGYHRLVRRVAAVLLLIGVLTAVAACAPPSSLSVNTVVSGLANPWDIAFTPDGTMLFTERAGRINAQVGGTTRVMATPPDVVAQGEGGMMGLAVDPDFASTRLIYTCFTTEGDGVEFEIRVVRWRVSSSYTSLENRTDIVTGIPADSQIHHGCRPRFGPDGNLWVTTGDGGISTAPQDRQSLAGKVLRVDRDGNGAPGNPGGTFLPQIYTYGHRNPQGIAFRPYDGKAFSVEHGTGCDDEVNLLQAGGNYGWDPTPGGPTDVQGSPVMTDKVRHPDAIDAVWRSGCPTIAPSGATFLSGGQWSGWNQALAVAVLKGQHVHIFGLGNGGEAVFDLSTLTGHGRLRSAVLGPEGDLYLAVDASPGRILRVHPTP